jgi:inorganic pyrophosphatase
MTDEKSVEVFVEIPRGSRNKYEMDHERHVLRLDRRLLSATTYPADYGYIPDTLSEDGDPLDALIILDEPTFPGCLVLARPIGVFWMEDEKGPDAKIITFVDRDPLWDHVNDISELPGAVRSEIEHFFEVYKTLEKKKTSTHGFEGVDAAWKEIEASRKRATATQ